MVANIKSNFENSSFWCKYCVYFLALIWCVGFVLGIIVLSVTDNFDFFSGMRIDFQHHVSIVGPLFVSSLPFLLTVITTLIHQTWMILGICFIKSFCYAYKLHVFLLFYGVTGWIIQIWFILFECISTVCLFLLWIKYISGKHELFFNDALVCVSVIIGISILEHFFLSPFLAAIL